MNEVKSVTEIDLPTTSETIGKSQTSAAAYLAIKDEIVIEAARIVPPQKAIGKTQTFTQTCSVMKDENVIEAERLLAGETSQIQPQCQPLVPTLVDFTQK
jgi:hypothetical protein